MNPVCVEIQYRFLQPKNQLDGEPGIFFTIARNETAEKHIHSMFVRRSNITQHTRSTHLQVR